MRSIPVEGAVNDPINARQDQQLEQLHEAAKDNRKTAILQWLALALVGLALAVYVNVVLVSALNIQGSTIRTIIERCK